jgi:hypothetical protein
VVPLAAVVLLVGCTTRLVVPDAAQVPGDVAKVPGDGATVPRDAAKVPGDAAKVSRDPARIPGDVVVRTGMAGVVVGAPHGGPEEGTGEIAAEVARRTGFGLAVAGDGDYERRVQEVSQGPLRFYVEIHGSHGGARADRIEISTVGGDAEEAVKLRTLLELVRDAHLRGRPPAMRLPIRMEPADPIVHASWGAKRDGILRLSERALHIELPRAARHEARELYAMILSDFLLQAVTLPLPVRR